jgi:hypothetical protein
MFDMIEKMIRLIEANGNRRSERSKEFNQAIDELYRALKNIKKYF